MKKYLKIILAILLSAGIIVSCKKEDNKDYAASIKNKTWWGQLTYTSKNPSYYSIHFGENGNFLWSEMSGDYPGQWMIDGKHLTITFSAGGRQIKADISNDNKLINIANNTADGYTINNGELIANPNTSSLDNTVWKGSYSVGTGIGMTTTMEITFTPGSKYQWKIGGTLFPPFLYTRSASGVIIRGPYEFFGMVVSGTEMKGTEEYSFYSWQGTKQ